MLVLVVEDNHPNMLLTKAVLERAGYDTVGAYSAEEARAFLTERRPDLILMDLQLSGEDGLSLTREIRTDPAIADIPIIALSAHAMKEHRWRVLTAGCDGYISKPIDTRAFAGQLQEILADTSAHGAQRR